MKQVYTAEEIAGIREACRIGREVLDAGGKVKYKYKYNYNYDYCH